MRMKKIKILMEMFSASADTSYKFYFISFSSLIPYAFYDILLLLEASTGSSNVSRPGLVIMSTGK